MRLLGYFDAKGNSSCYELRPISMGPQPTIVRVLGYRLILTIRLEHLLVAFGGIHSLLP